MTNETGLPALPEGYFWRVRHHETIEWGYHGSRTVKDKSRLQVCLIHSWTEMNVSEYPKPWYRLKATQVTDISTQEKLLFVEDPEGTHAIAVRNAANRIMKRWEKAKVRDALVGDYPPKTLEVS